MSLIIWVMAVIVAFISANALPWVDYLGVFVALILACISGASK